MMNGEVVLVIAMTSCRWSDTMILTCDVIRREIEAGRVVIEPFFADQVGPASIDLHLGDEIRVMHAGSEPVPVTDDVDYRTITEVRSLESPYPLAPGETIHGITRERITLPDDISGWLEGRSRFARLGLMIHVTSGFVQPGVASRQVLEMSNVSSRTLLIHSGVRLLQIVLSAARAAPSTRDASRARTICSRAKAARDRHTR
jgi:dCTP deaminase